MRIALVHPYSFSEVRRGGERYVWELAAHLGRSGHQVEVLTGTSGEPGIRREGNVVYRTVGHRYVKGSTRAGLGTEDAFALAVRRSRLGERFDIIHAFTPSAALAARLSGRAVIYTSLGAPNRAWFRTQPRVAFPMFWSAVRAVSEVTALTGWAADQIRSCTGRSPVVLPPGVRLEAFPPKAVPPAGPPRVLFASDASVEAKRLDLVLEAMGILALRRPDVRLVLGGPGDHRAQLHASGAAAAAIGSRIDAVGAGALDEVPARYRDASVTVLASAGEAFGLVLVESLASGTPVVCADAAGPPTIVDDPAIGRRFAADDVADLARALDEALDLAADPATPARAAAHATRWGWDEVVGPEHQQLYARVLDRAFSRRRAGARHGR